MAEPTVLGELTLRPPDTTYATWLPSRHPPSLTSQRGYAAAPTIVEGVSRGYNWDSSMVAAAALLHRLCCLLTLAWDVPWRLMDGPAPIGPGQYQIPNPLDPIESGAPSAPDPTVLPDWMEAAWAATGADPLLMSAVASYREAMLLRTDHPSMALIGFVAAVEAVAGRAFKVDRCPVCNQVRGSTRRFKAALTLVRPPEEVKRLSDVYEPRSRTAHEGRLHGHEALMGLIILPPFFATDPSWDFTWRTVEGMQTAARDLLRLALKGDLPEQISLTTEPAG